MMSTLSSKKHHASQTLARTARSLFWNHPEYRIWQNTLPEVLYMYPRIHGIADPAPACVYLLHLLFWVPNQNTMLITSTAYPPMWSMNRPKNPAAINIQWSLCSSALQDRHNFGSVFTPFRTIFHSRTKQLQHYKLAPHNSPIHLRLHLISHTVALPTT